MTKRPAPWPKGPFTVGRIGDVTRVLDGRGNDVMTQAGGPERLAACANAIPNDWHFPENAVAALSDRCERLEQLRKDAWTEAERRGAELDAIKDRSAA